MGQYGCCFQHWNWILGADCNWDWIAPCLATVLPGCHHLLQELWLSVNMTFCKGCVMLCSIFCVMGRCSRQNEPSASDNLPAGSGLHCKTSSNRVADAHQGKSYFKFEVILHTSCNSPWYYTTEFIKNKLVKAFEKSQVWLERLFSGFAMVENPNVAHLQPALICANICFNLSFNTLRDYLKCYGMKWNNTSFNIPFKR